MDSVVKHCKNTQTRIENLTHLTMILNQFHVKIKSFTQKHIVGSTEILHNILQFFDKNVVKATVLRKNYNVVDFTKYFLLRENFSVFHTLKSARATSIQLEKYFVKSIYITVTFFVKRVTCKSISQKFFVNCNIDFTKHF